MEKEPLLTRVWEVCATVASEESAQLIAKSLLDARLAACVQIAGPIRSCYRWKDELLNDQEWKLTVKTSQLALDSCWAAIRRLHPYEVAELMAYPVDRVSSDYEGWLNEQIAIPVLEPKPEWWHLRIAGRHSDAVASRQEVILGRIIQSISLPSGPSPLTVNFEQAAEKLSAFSNVHFEPDGSFVWGSTEYRPSTGRLWQLDCMVYDRANRIEYVELKGNCDRTTWESLISILSGVECTDLVVHWIAHGIWIDESEFRKCIV